jgi:uncharacterized repeat protein (TIGR02543 family)
MNKRFIKMAVVIVTAGLVFAGCTQAGNPEPEYYTVTFNAGEGGNVSPGSVEVVSGGTVGSRLPTPAKTEPPAVFWGWFTRDGTDSNWGSQFMPGTPVNADITVYARWGATAPTLCTVTFDTAGGTPVPAISGIVADSTISLPSAPTKTGYNFGGWYTEADGGGTRFTQDTPVTADITVYAKWTAKPSVGTAKTLVITDIPWTGKVTAALGTITGDNMYSSIAGDGDIIDGRAEIVLKNIGVLTNWTGTGSYHIFLWNGDLSAASSSSPTHSTDTKDPPIPFTETVTTISFMTDIVSIQNNNPVPPPDPEDSDPVAVALLTGTWNNQYNETLIFTGTALTINTVSGPTFMNGTYPYVASQDTLVVVFSDSWFPEYEYTLGNGNKSLTINIYGRGNNGTPTPDIYIKQEPVTP